MLKLYRRHIEGKKNPCIHGYAKQDAITETDPRPQCECPIAASGSLPNEEKRVLHRSTEKTDWRGAKHVAALWEAWGQTSEPGMSLILKTDPTIEEAVKSFTAHKAKTSTQGRTTVGKYEIFFRRRLLPWCASRGIKFMREFDSPVTVKLFFESWMNLQPLRGRSVNPGDVPDKQLGASTRKVELERYRTFLRFCVSQHWIKTNYALRDDIKVAKPETQAKFAFTMEEYGNILATLEEMQGNRKMGTEKASMVKAFVLLLRYTGQRIGDVAMLGPNSIVKLENDYFIELRQQKTGAWVKIPLEPEFMKSLQALPTRTEVPQPFTYASNNRVFNYGRSFWFWTGTENLENYSKDWSDDIDRVLKLTIKKFKKPFTNHATPHTFRHFFAISMLNAGVPIKMVSRWLGHSSVKITEEHYGHANADVHAASADAYRAAMNRIKGKPGGKVVKMRRAG